ncbi:Cysteine proteinase inhibitor 5 [Raphanus sativus]|uniref:Cysteine proteinase inhibitor 5 n=1 Tax=Raphanus sativus TaxID=3726 RepID=A0A6J0N1I2_RAPSA|nr:cysteine proteinase inhibitor 5 [Raphanus sativus]KAJ4901396.1 Cysteine proteinase inhibitor 5 [Raphanus sativus]
MNNKAIFLLFLSLVLLPLYASASPFVGGWRPLRNVSDPHVVEIGEFAVSEYNKQSKSGLKFVSVVSGDSQVVAGTNYRLIVAVNDGVKIANAGASKNYEAIVWEQPWLKSKNLTSFKPAMN